MTHIGVRAKINVRGKQTDGRTDATDRIILPAYDVVDKIPSQTSVPRQMPRTIGLVCGGPHGLVYPQYMNVTHIN